MSKEVDRKRSFTVDKVKYTVRQPTMQELTDANKKHRETFNEELEAGSLLRDQLGAELRKRQLWNDDREAEYQALRVDIINCEYELAKGGIKLSEAKKLALEMQDKRAEMVEMLSARTALDINTCEGKADAIRFNYLFANCLVYEDSGERYFKGGLDDYLKNQEDPVAEAGTTEFFYLMSKAEQSDSALPENKFLQQYKFANAKNQLVDKDGRLVDRTGKHIDELGFYIKWVSDTDYIKVDDQGREINKEGEFVVDHTPFLDDSGTPINETEYQVEEVKEEQPKKRTRKKATPAKESE